MSVLNVTDNPSQLATFQAELKGLTTPLPVVALARNKLPMPPIGTLLPFAGVHGHVGLPPHC